jgi:uncharacterized membrane protein YbhN (UPF0104 family)
MEKIMLVKRLLGLVALFVALTYFLYIWHTSPVNLFQHIKSIDINIFIGAIALSTIAGLINAILWFKINHNLDHSTSFPNTYWAWSVGRIYRYIPGKIAGYYIRQKLQRSSTKLGFVASINEFILVILPVLLLTLIYLITSNINTLIIIVISIALLLLYFLKPLVKVFFKFSIRSSSFINTLQSPSDINVKFLLIFPAMLLHGLSFYLIINMGGDKNSISIFQAVVALYISGLLGQLALIAPGGIGVREAAIVMILLTFGVDEDIAISTAIISRVILLLSELCNILLAIMFKRIE